MAGILANFGLALAFPAGILHEKMGLLPVNVAGLFTLVTPYLLLWRATFAVEFYTAYSYLLQVYFFLVGKITYCHFRINWVYFCEVKRSAILL